MTVNALNVLRIIDWRLTGGKRNTQPQMIYLPGLEPESEKYGASPRPLDEVKARLAALDPRWNL